MAFFVFLEEFLKTFCLDGALTTSYLQLKAASHEKQSVDTVDTGVQADYLAVAPG